MRRGSRFTHFKFINYNMYDIALSCGACGAAGKKDVVEVTADHNLDHGNPKTAPRKKWRWWHIALAVIAGVVLLSALSGGGTPKLTVRTSEAGAGFKQVQVLNAGDKPINITGLRINDRNECGPRPLPLSDPNDPFEATSLQIGESVGWFTACRVVRATFKTNAGSATYEFK